MLQMKLSSLNKYISLLIFCILFSPLHSEEQIDIWNKEKNKDLEEKKLEENNFSESINSTVFIDKKKNR